MKLFRYGLIYLLLAVFLAACGGGGGSAPAATSPPPPPPPPVTSAGVFLDSAVEGLTYQSGSNSPGTTDANGMFTYTVGETLTFSVGGVELGTLPDGAPVISPLDFGAAAENIARFLQTLDADGDPSNGIDLTAAAAALAETIVGDAVFLSDPITFENDIGPVLEVALGAGAMLIDAATALANLEAALDSTFDVAELAGHAFVVEISFMQEFDIGFIDFAPLADPGDSGSTVLTMFRDDSLAAGGDGDVGVDNWSVDADGILAITDPIAMSTTLLQKTGGSARAISFVAMEDSPGSDTFVGTLLVPVTVTAAALAGESGRTYDITIDFADTGPDTFQGTFFPDGTLLITFADGDFDTFTWEIDPNGVSLTLLEPIDLENELDGLVLVNGSYATGGDLLQFELSNLSGDLSAPVFELNEMNEGMLADSLTINFSGQLDIVVVDDGGAVYSGVPIGSNFFGEIDPVTANGFVWDAAIFTPFGCCIAAGGLSVSNDDILDVDTATLLNFLAGTSFVAGDSIDCINIEGDVLTAGGGRIEIGLSYILDPLAFDDESLTNYPPNPADILTALFFIAEVDDQGQDIYSALGVLDAIDPFP